MRTCLILATLFILSGKLYAQSAEDEVKTAVNKLFIAMRTSDSALLSSCFHANAIVQTIGKGQTVKPESVERFASVIGHEVKGSLDERIYYKQISIDGNLASVWTPYRFYLNDRYHHCGVNSFQLVKINGVWKIQYLIDTRRMEDCVEESMVVSPGK
ncbi:putative lumazine-binding protein [Chitinophaga dinghuensis]|uniref:Putative lumazine-binding protein n=1 Tax=Chitinophaga dinghuensis TaxID=1539050 RepID=A0A327VVW5_9BACT|nr:nuclear transport factor 2 family protein [Chitinophaga dinghuensis]RAJ79046.1 putative lumazine-binding protein [Chitinophaga dinghuensis]